MIESAAAVKAGCGGAGRAGGVFAQAVASKTEMQTIRFTILSIRGDFIPRAPPNISHRSALSKHARLATRAALG
jgi:hypothetical protein